MARDKIFITSGEVASRLGYQSKASFLINRAWLEKDLGFPSPLRHHRNPMLWRAGAVDTWLIFADKFGTEDEIDPAMLRAIRATMLQEASRSS